MILSETRLRAARPSKACLPVVAGSALGGWLDHHSVGVSAVYTSSLFVFFCWICFFITLWIPSKGNHCAKRRVRLTGPWRASFLKSTQQWFPGCCSLPTWAGRMYSGWWSRTGDGSMIYTKRTKQCESVIHIIHFHIHSLNQTEIKSIDLKLTLHTQEALQSELK